MFGVLFYLFNSFPGLTEDNFVALTVISTGAVIVPHYIGLGNREVSCVMAVVSVVLGMGIILNAWWFTHAFAGTPTSPVLQNVDSLRWWNDAIYHINPIVGEPVHPSHGIYGYVLAGVMLMFGESIGTVLLWSMSMTLIALLFTGLMIQRLTDDKKCTVIGMVAVASVCYWLSMGTVILKDPFVIAAMAIGGYGITFRGPRMLQLIAVAAVMLFLSRPSYNAMLLLGLLICAARREGRLCVLSACILCGALWYASYYFGINSSFLDVLSADESTGVRYDAPNQMPLYNLIGNYSEIAWYNKILLLPITVPTQFLIPFPWNHHRDLAFGVTQACAHFSYPWYLFGGVLMFYFVSFWKLRKEPLYRFTVWACLCWMVPCYLFGGTISRYGLPMVSLFSPAVALTLYRHYNSRIFRRWMSIFIVILAVCLIIARYMQSPFI